MLCWQVGAKALYLGKVSKFLEFHLVILKFFYFCFYVFDVKLL